MKVGTDDSWGEDRFRLAAYIVAGALLLVGLYLRFDYDPPAPRRPPRPVGGSTATLASLDYSPSVYRALLVKDSRDYGVAETTPEQLASPFAYDLSEPRMVLDKENAGVETRQLKIWLGVEELQTQSMGRVSHLVLHVQNKTDEHLAFQVQTVPTGDGAGSCNDKVDIVHDALALAPHASLERSECAAHAGRGVTGLRVERIETMVLPPLSFFYVSRLFPPHIGADARATRGHAPPKGKVCVDIPEQAIRRGFEKGTVSWRDVVDFYARHTCEKYLFPVGYRAFARAGQYALPVSPQSLSQAGGGLKP